MKAIELNNEKIERNVETGYTKGVKKDKEHWDNLKNEIINPDFMQESMNKVV